MTSYILRKEKDQRFQIFIDEFKFIEIKLFTLLRVLTLFSTVHKQLVVPIGSQHPFYWPCSNSISLTATHCLFWLSERFSHLVETGSQLKKPVNVHSEWDKHNSLEQTLRKHQGSTRDAYWWSISTLVIRNDNPRSSGKQAPGTTLPEVRTCGYQLYHPH